jgi:hypothetical protein
LATWHPDSNLARGVWQGPSEPDPPPADGADWIDRIERDGFVVITGVFSGNEIETLAQDLAASIQGAAGDDATILSSGGVIYAARNVLSVFPLAQDIWRREPLLGLLGGVLGAHCGLVRGLYFDKPPERTWTLPWHKDLTIAVRDNRLPSETFAKPTVKAGVPHVEAPRELLEAMLTLRIHLDDVTDENGPLRVIPGSHREGKQVTLSPAHEESILALRGDVLAIRPLVAHSSAASQAGTALHRRILHLEFAAWPELPDGYAWHEFLPVARTG